MRVAWLRRHDRSAHKLVPVPEGQTEEADANHERPWLWPHLGLAWHLMDFVTIELPQTYPTEDAYMAACRAGHWRTAQLRAHGIEPLDLTKVANLTQYPPDDFDWKAAEAAS